MRIVMLTGHTPEGEVQHRYVAQRIADEFPRELVGIIVATGANRSFSEKLKKWLRRYSVRDIASQILVRIHQRLTRESERREAIYRATLFPAGDDGNMPRRDLLAHVLSHNGEECRALLLKLKPDIVVVYGTLIIGKRLIETMPRIINLHTGLSPRYRGSDTNFWPIHNQEPHYLGVTVHRLDPGIDSGPILARGAQALEENDNEHSIFAKAVRLGAELLCNAIRREADGSAKPLQQVLADGREYRSMERTLTARRRVRRLLRGGILKGGIAEWREEF